MVNASDVSTEERLAEILAQCGFASESPSLSRSWADLQMLHHPSLARHLTDDKYKNLFVAVEGEAFQIYSWIMLVCELRGEVPEDRLTGKLELCASPDKSPRDDAECICLDLPLPFYHYGEEKFIGVDEMLGRFGQVTLKQCRHCQRWWLHYFVEYEAFRASGRYFMGLITSEVARTITPETAVNYLESLEWHLYGGSYFYNRTGKSTSKRIYVDC